MRIVLDQSSAQQPARPSWGPLQKELTRSCDLIFSPERDLEPGRASEAGKPIIHDLSELTEEDCFISLHPLADSHPLFTSAPPYKFHKVLALADECETDITASQVEKTLFISDLSPLEIKIPVSLLRTVLDRYLYLPPSFETDNIDSTKGERILIFAEKEDSNLLALNSLATQFSKQGSPEVRYPKPDQPLDSLLQELAGASLCLNDLREARIHQKINLAATILGIPSYSWAQLPPVAQQRHWACGLPTPKTRQQDLRDKTKLRPCLNAALNATQAAIASPANHTWLGTPNHAPFHASAQVRYLLSQVTRSPTEPGLKRLQRLTTELLRCPDYDFLAESKRHFSPTYTNGKAYTESYHKIGYRSASHTFLKFWNKLPQDSEEKLQFEPYYKIELENYAKFAMFRSPTPDANLEFIENYKDLEGWIDACQTATPLVPQSVSRVKGKHNLNPFTPLSITDIVFGFLSPQLPSFFNPQAPKPNSPLLDTAETLLRKEIDLGFASQNTFSQLLFLALAKRSYSELPKIAEQGTASQGVAPGYQATAGILLAMHNQREKSRSVFQAQSSTIEELLPSQQITMTLYAICMQADVSKNLWQAINEIDDLPRKISSDPNLLAPLAFALCSFPKTQKVGDEIWNLAIERQADIANLDFLKLQFTAINEKASHLTPEELENLGREVLKALSVPA